MKYLPTLDGWRAIAILMVMAHHAAVGWSRATGHAEPRAFFQLASGVDLFFAISGLLITTRLFADPDLRRFYIRRAARILPPALLFLGVSQALGLSGSRNEMLSCLTFWRNYLPFDPAYRGYSYIGHFWSLSVEEQFYLAWPLALLLAGKRMPRILFWTILGVNVWRVFYVLSASRPVLTRTDVCVDGLLWGCLAAFELAAGRNFGGWAPVAPLLLVTSVYIYHGPLGFPLVPAMLAFAVLSTVQSSGLVCRLLNHPVLTFVGRRSYGIYIWQQLFLLYGKEWPYWPLLPLRLVALAAVVELSYRSVELPLRKLGRTLGESKPQARGLEPEAA